jgi:hypothetical protein
VAAVLSALDKLLEPDANDFTERPKALATVRFGLFAQIRWHSDCDCG